MSSDADLEVLVPAWNAVRDILRKHPLGAGIDDVAALITLKVTAMTWALIREAAPELAGSRQTPGGPGPDDRRFL